MGPHLDVPVGLQQLVLEIFEYTCPGRIARVGGLGFGCERRPGDRVSPVGTDHEVARRLPAALEQRDGARIVLLDPNAFRRRPHDAVIKELQEDLPLAPRPFDDMARRLGISANELFEMARSFQQRGVMRRYSAVLHHRRAGFDANAMVVWRVPPEKSEEVGRIMASSPWVTHCYERPTFPDWPYTHFTMIHATGKEKCEGVAAEISAKTGITDYRFLYSTQEYKKTRVRYFV